MTAFSIPRGQIARVTKVDLVGKQATRLAQLGIRQGATVQMLGYSLFRSAVLLGVGAVRVAVDKTLATAVEVV